MIIQSGCFKETYVSWVHHILSNMCGSISDVDKNKIGYIILTLHAIAAVGSGLIPFLVPLTAVWIVLFCIGSALMFLHWHVLGGCCITPIENYFLGIDLTDMNSFILKILKQYLMIDLDMNVINKIPTIGALVCLVILWLRWRLV